MKVRKRFDFLEDLILEHGLKICAEIGVGSGRTTAAVMSRCKNVSWIAVDHWPAGYALLPAERGFRTEEEQLAIREMFKRATRAFGDRLVVLPMPSVAASAVVPDASIDLVFIDGDHSYEGCRSDIAAWAPKVKPGGFVTGHDYSRNFPGVIQAVDEIYPQRTLHEDDVWMICQS